MDSNCAPPTLYIMTVLSACAVVLAATQSITAVRRSCWNLYVIESWLLRRCQPRKAVTGLEIKTSCEFGCRALWRRQAGTVINDRSNNARLR